MLISRGSDLVFYKDFINLYKERKECQSNVSFRYAFLVGSKNKSTKQLCTPETQCTPDCCSYHNVLTKTGLDFVHYPLNNMSVSI